MCKRNWGRNSGHLLHNGVIKLNLPVETSGVMSNMSKKNPDFYIKLRKVLDSYRYIRYWTDIDRHTII